MKIKVEKADLETYGEEKESEDISIDEVIEKIKFVLKKLSTKDFIIVLLVLMMFLMYVVYQKDMMSCNSYYQNLMKNMTQLTTSLW